MNVAVLISGDYRCFDLVAHTYDFLLADADIYVSCWTSSNHFHPKKPSLSQSISNLTKEHIRNTLYAYGSNVKEILLEEYSDNIWQPGKFIYNQPMCHRWRAGIKLIKESKREYDFIVVVRPDLYFKKSEPINFQSLDRDSIYAVWFNPEIPKLTDTLLIGTPKNIDKALISKAEWALLFSVQNDWHISYYSYVRKYRNLNIRCADEFIPPHVFARPPITKDSSFSDAAYFSDSWRNLWITHQKEVLNLPTNELIRLWGEQLIKSLFPDLFPVEVAQEQP
jgi:hypothetical protein